MKDDEVRPAVGRKLGATTTDLPWSLCPECGYRMDAATSMFDPDARPKPSDVALCLDCAALLVYEPNLTLRKMTDIEHDEIPEKVQMEIYQARVAIRRLPKRNA